MTNAISGTTGSPAPTPASTTANATSGLDPAATKQMFMTLLVAQLKNQDPTHPTDGVQFLQQLTDISNLEQLLGMRQDLDKMAGTTALAAAGSKQPNTRGGQ